MCGREEDGAGVSVDASTEVGYRPSVDLADVPAPARDPMVDDELRLIGAPLPSTGRVAYIGMMAHYAGIDGNGRAACFAGVVVATAWNGRVRSRARLRVLRETNATSDPGAWDFESWADHGLETGRWHALSECSA